MKDLWIAKDVELQSFFRLLSCFWSVSLQNPLSFFTKNKIHQPEPDAEERKERRKKEVGRHTLRIKEIGQFKAHVHPNNLFPARKMSPPSLHSPNHSCFSHMPSSFKLSLKIILRLLLLNRWESENPRELVQFTRDLPVH